MTETRKQLIELLEPYMNKDLSEGCYIKTWLNSPDDETMSADMTDTTPKYSKFQLEREFNVLEFKDVNNDYWNLKSFEITYKNAFDTNDYGVKYLYMGHKILGHYDISAVLKYIRNFNKYIECSGDAFFIAYQESYGEGWYIPNKPLHLYTEQEEKELLNNLKQLGKQ